MAQKSVKKIFIHRFHCLNNYGTAMMGLVTINGLQKRYGDDTEFYCQCNGHSGFDEIQSELAKPVKLANHEAKNFVKSKYKWVRSYQKRKYLIDASEVAHYDEVLVLGGDDLSEYYTQKIYRDLLQYWRWSKATKLILLGQSIGPFERWRNRFVMKHFYKRIPIFVRDAWSKDYLKKAFGLEKNIYQSADLAFMDLPLQSDKSIETAVLNRYDLEKKKYITLVISGLQGKYYTTDKNAYFNAYKSLIKNILTNKNYQDKKLVLLAHTFPPHGNEAAQIKDLVNFLKTDSFFTTGILDKIIPITDKILATRARFILGNGYMTVTGRMHAAISTLQMGTPAIALSYSAKYQGVIGLNLDRSDLIIESNESKLWESGEIVNLITEKMAYVTGNYERLSNEIKHKVTIQKQLVEETFNQIASNI